MMRHSAVFCIVSAVVLNLLFTGCGRQSQQRKPNQPASGQTVIEADCIVQYFKSNASAYITQQRHRYIPEAGFFQATATEPIGTIQCSLQQDVFQSSGQKQEVLSDLPGSFCDKNLATVLFYSFCAGGGLLDTGSMTSGEPVKVLGQWYRPLTPAWPADAEVKILQSADAARVELLQLTDPHTDVQWLVRCYNYRYSKQLETRLPRTIDVYNMRNSIASKELMIRFDYNDIRKITPVQGSN